MKQFALLFITVLIVACTATTNNPDPAPGPLPNPDPVPLPEGPLVKLEGIYATSEKTPHYAEKVFDEKEGAFWQTMAGAGPDEGLMLYFAEPTVIAALEIEQAVSPGITPFENIVVYGDGRNLDTFDLSDKINIGQRLSSLYIRISEKGITTSETRMINEETSLNITSFPETKSVGIANLYLYNEAGKRLFVQPPKSLRGRIRASSTLAPEPSYHSGQLFDSRKDFVWVEGAEGHGTGESLLLQVTEPTRFDAVKIWNGYQRSNEHWVKNGKAAKIRIGDGANGHEYELKNTGEPQLISLVEPMTVREMHINFLDVHKGSRYPDMVISEMRLYDSDQIMVIRTTDRENFKQDLLEQAEGTILEDLLDYRIKNYIAEEYDYQYFYDKSLILRSDYSFVAYEYNETYEENETKEEIIAEGNWELLDLQADKARIKIFGKYINLSELHDFYKGKSNKEVLSIFKDELTIEKGEIRGDKFFEVFYMD